jgi:hypothetical protein
MALPAGVAAAGARPPARDSGVPLPALFRSRLNFPQALPERHSVPRCYRGGREAIPMENAEHLRMMAKRALALAIETTDNPELVESLVVMAGQYLEQVAALELAREAAQPTRPADRPDNPDGCENCS